MTLVKTIGKTLFKTIEIGVCLERGQAQLPVKQGQARMHSKEQGEGVIGWKITKETPKVGGFSPN